MAATIALREALNQGISSGSFIDTKIILYSHRDSSGQVCRPKALYANSRILRTVPYFNDRESAITLGTTWAESQCRFKVLFGNFSESQSKDFSKEEIDDEEPAEDYGYWSDSDLEEDEDEKSVAPSSHTVKSRVSSLKHTGWLKIAPFKHTSRSKVHPLDPSGVPSEDKIIPCEEYEEHVEKGKIVKIPDIAFVT